MLRTLVSVVVSAVVGAGCAAVVVSPVPTQSAAPSPTPTPSSASTAGPTAGASDALPAVLDVHCGPGAPTLGSDRVRTSPGGVRFHVTGQPGWELGIDHESGHDAVLLEAANQDVVLGVAPGDVSVNCSDPTLSSAPSTSPLRIEDPDSWYRAKTISDGAGSCVSNSVDYAEGARGKAAGPIQQAREMLRGLQTGDVVERAGYATDKGWVRVVRDGKVIGTLAFDDDGHGGWLYSGSTLCANLGTG